VDESSDDKFAAAWGHAADLVRHKNHDTSLTPPAVRSANLMLKSLGKHKVPLKGEVRAKVMAHLAMAFIHGFLMAELLHEATEATETVH